MPKKPKRKNLKPPGKCIFCGGGAVPGNPMTGEHLWSDWMTTAGLLPRRFREYEEFSNRSRRYTGEASTFKRSREGAPSHKKIKVVCKQCNSGWMSTIETNVQPILTPLIKGQKTVLSRANRKLLVEWITLKILVAEHNEYQGFPADPIFDQHTRDAFKLHRTIPKGLRIYLTPLRGVKWFTGYHRHASGLGFTAPSFPLSENPTGVRNVEAITWGIGRLLIYLSAVTDPEIYNVFRLGRTDPLCRLWPLTTSEIGWPRPHFVTDAFADELAGALQRFLNANMAKPPPR